jgi:ribosomal protein S18 acetylase RimI-like enzyme
LLPKPWGQNPSGFRFFLRVVKPYRRRGIGTALVSAVADEARRWGSASLRAWQAFPDGPESMFLRCLGFKQAGGYLHFEADLSKLYSMLSPLRDRLVAGAKIPREARLIPLSDAPLEKVMDLHCRYLGGSRSLLARQMQGEGEHAFSPADSVVLMMGDEVMGEALWGLEEETARVEGRVIDPRCRGSWANVLLMTTAAERGFARGARKVRFLCLDNNKDTRKLAKRCEASVKSSETFYALYL